MLQGRCRFLLQGDTELQRHSEHLRAQLKGTSSWGFAEEMQIIRKIP
jgi:hypothetical protein